MAKRKNTILLVVHVTATPPSVDIGVKEVRQMHIIRGFTDIGYHYVIRRNGKVETGRAEDEIGAHVQGYNSNSIGVSLVGGVNAKGQPEHNATAAQMAALEALLKKLSAKYPQAGVCGHRDLSPDKDGDGVIEPFEHIKACPCFDAIPWAASKGLKTAKIKGIWYRKATAPAPVTVKQDNAFPQPAAHGMAANLQNFDKPARLPVPAERPQLTAQQQAVIDDAAAEGRLSKTEVLTGLGGISGTAQAVKETVDAVNEGATSLMSLGPWILLALVSAGFALFVIYERRRKKAAARAAMHV